MLFLSVFPLKLFVHEAGGRLTVFVTKAAMASMLSLITSMETFTCLSTFSVCRFSKSVYSLALIVGIATESHSWSIHFMTGSREKRGERR